MRDLWLDTEPVTITPQSGLDEHDDPLPAGTPFTVNALVAPGNTTLRPGADAELDQADYTLYMPLRVEVGGKWVQTAIVLTEEFTVTVRGRVCVGRVKDWDLSGRGGLEVLASSKTGGTP